jgi:ribosomal protein S18 acetylase RimI-like enzyme
MQAAQDVSTSLPVKPQAFEADVFGAPVWRLDIERDATLTSRDLLCLTEQARDDGVALIVARLPVDDARADALSQAGFRQIERLLAFRRDIAAPAEPVGCVTLAGPKDAEECAEIARRSFTFDRFHADPQLPDAAADEIKARWARNGVNGRADAPLIVREDGSVAGFNLCMRKGADAVIDLIAVDAPWRSRGLGRKLIAGALAHYAGVAPTMWVSTQEGNVVSIALYRAAGFAFHGAALTWHWTSRWPAQSRSKSA